MALAPPAPDVLNFAARVAAAYTKLIASPHADPEIGLGGQLFYAGDLDDEGRALVVAANIAGAATLVASANPTAQKQAIRDGVADFLVTSLDEALRILKNQLRKRETAAVCVAIEPAEMEREMEERGVAPDILRREASVAAIHEAVEKEAFDETDPALIPALVIWQVESARHQSLAKLDEIALQCLDDGDWISRRWLHQAPRYLGRMAQGLRLLSTHREFYARFAEQIRACADRGEIAFSCEVLSFRQGELHDQVKF